MKILLTNHELNEGRGGTQVFIIDLARELKARGHEVTVYAASRGPLAQELESAGVPVIGAPADCGYIPDIIHGQHHLAAMAALSAFPDTPAIYHCHGVGPWEEQPPAHPRIRRYVGMTPTMAPWMAGRVNRGLEDMVTLPTSVHLGRFQRVRTLPEAPKRALQYGNTLVPEETLACLKEACRAQGITLDFVGATHGNPTDAPQDILPEYDIVFGIGRCALEAMASGCAVMPFSASGCLPFVQPDTFSRHWELNLTVPDTVPETTVERISERLRGYHREQAAAVTAAVRAEAGFGTTCDRLEALYQEVVAEKQSRHASSWIDECRALGAYLESLAPRIHSADQRYLDLLAIKERTRLRLGKLKDKFDVAQEKHAALQSKHTALDARWKNVENRLPAFLRNWLLRGSKSAIPSSDGDHGVK